MATKLQFNRQPDPFGQVISQLSAVDHFLISETTAKSPNYPVWNTLASYRALAGFAGFSYSSTRWFVKSRKIPGYRINGTYYFLVHDVINAINKYENIARFIYASYNDPGNEDELMIHWKKLL